ncbi:MAG: dihydroflavonol-4-reductase [Gammaproteobacteria bacterium]|jgi:dihydroflavonol-4-reductase
MKKAYITGGTGCVGRNVIDVLLKDDWQVVAVHRRSSNTNRLKDLNIELREVNLHNYDEVAASVDDDIDCVFHVAANTSEWPLEAEQQYNDNVTATRNLVRACVAKKIKKFVFTSTGAASPYQSYSEEEARNISNQYIRTKRLSEFEVAKGIEQGLDVVTVLPAIVVGAYDYNNYSQMFVLCNEGNMKGILPGKIVFCHAAEVGKAHVSAYEKGLPGMRYHLGGPYMSWYDFMHVVAKQLKVSGPVLKVPIPLLFLYSYPALWLSYITKKKPLLTPSIVHLLNSANDDNLDSDEPARQDLGYKNIPIDIMVSDCIEWMRGEGML